MRSYHAPEELDEAIRDFYVELTIARGDEWLEGFERMIDEIRERVDTHLAVLERPLTHGVGFFSTSFCWCEAPYVVIDQKIILQNLSVSGRWLIAE